MDFLKIATKMKETANKENEKAYSEHLNANMQMSNPLFANKNTVVQTPAESVAKKTEQKATEYVMNVPAYSMPGTVNSKVSANAINALSDFDLESYTPSSSEELGAIRTFEKYSKAAPIFEVEIGGTPRKISYNVGKALKSGDYAYEGVNDSEREAMSYARKVPAYNVNINGKDFTVSYDAMDNIDRKNYDYVSDNESDNAAIAEAKRSGLDVYGDRFTNPEDPEKRQNIVDTIDTAQKEYDANYINPREPQHYNPRNKEKNEKAEAARKELFKAQNELAKYDSIVKDYKWFSNAIDEYNSLPADKKEAVDNYAEALSDMKKYDFNDLGTRPEDYLINRNKKNMTSDERKSEIARLEDISNGNPDTLSSDDYKYYKALKYVEAKDSFYNANIEFASDNLIRYAEYYANDEKYKESVKDLNEKSNGLKGGTVSTVGSVLVSPLKVFGLGETISAKIQNRPIDPNSDFYDVSNAINTVRSNVRGNIEKGYGKIGAVAYDLATNLGDFAVTMAIGHGVGNIASGLGASATLAGNIASGTTQALMSSSVAADTIKQAKRDGASDTQATVMGVAAGVLEAIFEKFSIDRFNVFKNKSVIPGFGNRLKAIALNAVKGFLPEATEELSTNLANQIVDNVIMGENSAYNRRVKELIAEGETEAEADKMATKELASGAFYDWLLGGFSGSLMNAGATIMAPTTKSRAQYLNDYARKVTELYPEAKFTLLDPSNVTEEEIEKFSKSLEPWENKVKEHNKKVRAALESDADSKIDELKDMFVYYRDNASADLDEYSKGKTEEEITAYKAAQRDRANDYKTLIGKYENLKHGDELSASFIASDGATIDTATHIDITDNSPVIIVNGRKPLVIDENGYIFTKTPKQIAQRYKAVEGAESVSEPTTTEATAETTTVNAPAQATVQNNKPSESNDTDIYLDENVQKTDNNGDIYGVSEYAEYIEEAEAPKTEEVEAPTPIKETKAEAAESKSPHYNIAETTHTRTGEVIWTVELNDKLNDEDFAKLKEDLKPLGGNYSRYSKMFIFNEAPTKEVTSVLDRYYGEEPTASEDASTIEVQNNTDTVQNNTDTVQNTVKKATGFGDNGTALVAQMKKKSGEISPSDMKKITNAYLSGFTFSPGATAPTYNTEAEKRAFDAGVKDRETENATARETAKKASAYTDGIVNNEYYKALTRAEKTMAKTIADDLGLRVEFVAQLIYDTHEANAEHSNGKLKRSSNSENQLHQDIIHEALHRMKQLSPDEAGLLINALYKYSLTSGNGNTYSRIKNKYDNANVSLSTYGIIEEIAAKELESIFNSEKDWNKWHDTLGQGTPLEKAWNKFKSLARKVIDDAIRVYNHKDLTADGQIYVQSRTNQLEEIKKLYADTYRASEKAVEKIQAKNSQNDGGNNSADGYNVDTQFSVKKQWHTGFPMKVVNELEQRVERDARTSTRIITETANWYTTRIDGNEYFVIYSTEDSSPTILYASRDKRAEFERNILLNALEDIENGESINGKSKWNDWISNRGWLRQGNSVQNTVQRVGRGSNNRNAGLLQGQSRRKPSRAFRDVLETLFAISDRRNGRGVTQDSNTQNSIKETTKFSLKDSDGSNIDPARITNNELDVSYSIKFSGEIAEAQTKYLGDHKAYVTADELKEAQRVTQAMVDVMMEYSSILPEDKIGKVLTKNSSYDISTENTTICVRTLAYNEFVDMVQERIGRPLTQMESFLVSQKLYDIATEPQCLYCYVSLDRKAFNDMLLRYMEDRDTVIAKYNNSDKSPKARDELFQEFLHGRKETKEKKSRFDSWLDYADNGTTLLSLADIATEARQAEIKSNGGNLATQLADARKYAQSASWSKIQKNYVAYRDEILKLSDKVVNDLNKHYGLRWYSFSDYSAAFIVENMQQITDAAIRGLKGLSYTKDTDFAEIFAPSGMNINISVFVSQDKNGNFYIDEKQSANFEKAKALRKKFPNVGIVAVVTNDEALRWAGEQEWSDVIIPFHIVRTGTDVAEYYKWLNYTSESGDTVKDKDLWEAYVDSLNLKSENARKKVSKNIYPSEHKNNKSIYLNLCESRGLSPRFARFVGEDWYMKLVNETRLSSDESTPLKPTYNLEKAKDSFQKFVDKGGYEGGWYKEGVDVSAEVETVANDVLEGKKANEVDYGRQDNFSPEALVLSRKSNRTHGKSFSVKTSDTSFTRSHSNEAIAFAEQLALSRGYTLETFSDKDISIPAMVDKVNRVVRLNLASYRDPVDLLGHELFHTLTEADQQSLARYFKLNAKTDTEEFKAYKEKTMRDYQKANDMYKDGKEFTETDFWYEFAAENCRTLFSNRDLANEIANKNSSLAKRILNTLRRLWYSITGKSIYTSTEATKAAQITADTLAKAEKMYAEALKTRSLELPTNSVVKPNMSDADRFDVLKDKIISAVYYDKEKVSDIDLSKLNSMGATETEKFYKKLGEKLGIYKQYHNNDIDISFEFSKGGMSESLHKQGKTLKTFNQMLSVLDDIAENAVCIEVHDERYDNPRSTVDTMYILVSAFENEEGIVPVRLTVKTFVDNTTNKLHVVISTSEVTGIKKSRGQGITWDRSKETAAHYSRPAFDISIADLFANVNPLDVDFLKYVPNGFLNEEQLTAKEKGVKKTEAYIAKKNERYASPITISTTEEAHAADIGFEEPDYNDNLDFFVDNEASESVEAETSSALDRIMGKVSENKRKADKEKGVNQGFVKDKKRKISFTVGGLKEAIAQTSRTLRYIPERGERGTFFAEARKTILNYKRAGDLAQDSALTDMQRYISLLNADEFKLFETYVILKDMEEDIERNGEDILLPNGFKAEDVIPAIEEAEARMSDNVRKAFEERQRVFGNTVRNYVEYNRRVGFDTANRFTRENYFHHEVIEYTNSKKGKGQASMHINASRGYLKTRNGTSMDIDTDLLRVDYETLRSMKHDTYRAKALHDLKLNYDIKDELQRRATQENAELMVRFFAQQSGGKFDANGKPDSEASRKTEEFNKQIGKRFGQLISLAKDGKLPDVSGRFSAVVNGFADGKIPDNSELYTYLAELSKGIEGYDKKAVAAARDILKHITQKNSYIREILGSKYQTWETILERDYSDTYTIVQPRVGRNMYSTEVIDAEKLNDAVAFLVDKMLIGDTENASEDLKTELARTIRILGAPYQQWVLPNEIAAQIETTANTPPPGNIAKFCKGILNAWKRWVTGLNPFARIKYWTRNVVGDFDAVLAGAPGIVKKIPQAIRELTEAYSKDGTLSEGLIEWKKRGGFQQLSLANELDNATKRRIFANVADTNTREGWAKLIPILKEVVTGNDFNEFREAILRYSAFIYFKEKIQRDGGVTDYVASNRRIIRGLKDNTDKAYQMANDLLGAYDQVSTGGQILRSFLIPFYSFTETNFKRYSNLIYNAILNDAATGEFSAKKYGRAGAVMLKKFGMRFIQMNLIGFALLLWNNLVMGDLEKELPESVQRRPHIVLGKFGDYVVSFDRVGSFAEYLEWMGLDSFWEDRFHGDSVWETIANIPTDALDKAVNMSNPYVKLAVELIFGKSVYPSITSPSVIRDKWEYAIDNLTGGVGGDIYNAIAKRPSRGLAHTAFSLLVYLKDFKESAYNDVLYEYIPEWRDKVGETNNSSSDPNEMSNALYYMKKAIKYKDRDSALAQMEKYFELGGTSKKLLNSLDSLSPLNNLKARRGEKSIPSSKVSQYAKTYGVSRDEVTERFVEFVEGLNDNERDKFAVALDYYRDELSMPKDILNKLEDLDEDDTDKAKKLLTRYIDKMC